MKSNRACFLSPFSIPVMEKVSTDFRISFSYGESLIP